MIWRWFYDSKNYLVEIIDNQYQRTKKYIYPYYFIPILAEHTGCRLEELCMMKTEDIVKVGKVWVYKIKETGDYGDEETKVNWVKWKRCSSPLDPDRYNRFSGLCEIHKRKGSWKGILWVTLKLKKEELSKKCREILQWQILS